MIAFWGGIVAPDRSGASIFDGSLSRSGLGSFAVDTERIVHTSKVKFFKMTLLQGILPESRSSDCRL
jgi:hypothetical protein